MTYRGPTPDPTRRFVEWGATADELPALVSRCQRPSSSDDPPRDVWLRHLFDQYAPALLRYALSWLRNEADADEAVVDTFVLAARQLDGYRRDRSPPRAWLYFLAGGVIRNRRRAVQRRAKHEEAQADPVPLVDEPTIDGDLTLRQAVDCLPSELRDVWRLRRVEGLSIAEAAVALELAEGTVNSRLNRAERVLHALIHDDAPRADALVVPLAAVDPRTERELSELQRLPPRDPRAMDELWQRIRRRLGFVTTAPGSAWTPMRGMTRALVTHALAASLGAIAIGSVRSTPRPSPPPAVTPATVTTLAAARDVSRSESPPPAIVWPAAPAPPTVAPVASPAAASAPTVIAVRPRPSPVAHAPAPDDDEPLTRHLRRARNALQQGNAAAALAALADARRASPTGDGNEYIDSLEVEAVALAGDAARARRLLDAFAARYPRSPHLARLQGR